MEMSGMIFSDVSSEKSRTYLFDETEIEIFAPLWLNVSASGGHRLINADGESYYIAPRWLAIRWRAKEGSPAFVL